MSSSAQTASLQTLPVYRSAQFNVVEGANLGDPIGFSQELMLDDVYMLSAGSDLSILSLQSQAGSSFVVAQSSRCGTPGAALHLDCCITLMTPDGSTSDALIFVELDTDGNVAQVFLAPLALLKPRVAYALVGFDKDRAKSTLAEWSCARFTRGTHLAMATGEQRKIDDIRVGDRLLTRDDGPHTVRWIGASTVRAEGDFAPVCIRAGTLNNLHDLVVSPQHRLFIYQRKDRLGAGRSELLVQARHLVNGNSVTVQSGGFVEYFQLLFDDHHIVYAEGIAAESMLVDTITHPALPHEVAERLTTGVQTHAQITGLDVQEHLLRRPDAADLLRRASTG